MNIWLTLSNVFFALIAAMKDTVLPRFMKQRANIGHCAACMHVKCLLAHWNPQMRFRPDSGHRTYTEYISWHHERAETCGLSKWEGALLSLQSIVFFCGFTACSPIAPSTNPLESLWRRLCVPNFAERTLCVWKWRLKIANLLPASFIPRDAMLARYKLWIMSVWPSVRPSKANIVSHSLISPEMC